MFLYKLWKGGTTVVKGSGNIVRRKPSIFSKDYERKMRHRKVKIFGISIICLAVIVLIGVYLTGTFKSALNDVNKQKQSMVSNSKKQSSTSVKKPSQVSKPEEKSKDKGSKYAVSLTNGKKINLIYETKNNDKVFKDVTPKDANVVYSISPSGKNILVFDDKSQSILKFDSNGNKQDVTNPQYVSTTGSTIEKNAQLSSNPNYIWCSSPKFIDENNIAYVSQLPWIGKTAKYVWVENLQTKANVMVQSIEGADIKFDAVTDKGLTTIVDGNTVYVTTSGEISQ